MATGRHATAPRQNFQADIERVLRDEPDTPENAAYDEVVALLKETARGIHATAFAGAEDAIVRIEPSFTVNLGQQFKMVVSIPAQGFSDVLFKAYVPMDGYPVTLDLFGNRETVCRSERALREAILRFLANRDIRKRLRGLRDMLS